MKRNLRASHVAVIGFGLICAACAGTPTEPRATTLATGRWGGDGACLIVTEQGCDLTVGCAHGQFARPTVREDGSFDIDGTYRIEVGPVSTDPAPPAHFSGVVTGSTLTLTVVPSVATIPRATYVMTLGTTGACGVRCL